MPTPWSLQAPALPSADLSLVVGSSWGTTAAGNGRFPIYDRCSTNTAACFPVLVGGIDPFRLVLFEFADQNWGVSSCPSVLQLFARYWEPQFVDDDFQHQEWSQMGFNHLKYTQTSQNLCCTIGIESDLWILYMAFTTKMAKLPWVYCRTHHQWFEPHGIGTSLRGKYHESLR